MASESQKKCYSIFKLLSISVISTGFGFFRMMTFIC